MKLEDYDYELPLEYISQSPIENRSDSKLLLLDKDNGNIKEDIFKNIGNYLTKGDVLVLNDTKVIPARLIGKKKDTGAVIELLLLKELNNNIWECLCKPAKRLHVGSIISFGDLLESRVIEKLDNGIIHVEMIYDGIFLEILDTLGKMPLPPYIHEVLKDNSRYQTVYAKNVGSAAAPTAGLHFTKELLKSLEESGVIIEYVTLHVGLGTFRPVEVEDITKHHMHSEYYYMSEDTAKVLNKAKEEGRNIYAVGTTTTRVLETIMHKYDKFMACSGDTDIFIYPNNFEFKAIDGLITNFHLPKSTLLMLVSTLATKEYILASYEYAKAHNFRFFSFGDAMFIKKPI